VKKIMHIMVDDPISTDDYEIISSKLESLNEKYDIIITSYNTSISIYDPQELENINQKLDIIMSELGGISKLKNDIKQEIKYVFGGREK
jgi:tetrahydromethanopterin S-methyltransferase subunit G